MGVYSHQDRMYERMGMGLGFMKADQRGVCGPLLRMHSEWTL